jgi:tetratricopeptide (TPR) repeat protein
MSLWSQLTDRLRSTPQEPRRLDYVNEALALERHGDFTGAITSYQLGIRANPNDPRLLQYIAIAFTKTGQPAEAIRHYRKALALDETLSGAHYGLSFLLLKQGDAGKAAEHLRAFLARPPKGPDAERWIQHAQNTLRQLDEVSEPHPAGVGSF